MDYEKKYKDALERARELVEKWIGKNKNFYIEDYSYIFPELKESEDDRIRKEIIRIVDIWTGSSPVVNGIPRETLLAWLEKQKMIDILDEEEKEFAEDADAIRKMCDEAYQNGYNEGRRIEKEIWLEKQGEKKETNLVEILKHYPRETELYSPLYGKLWLAEVDEEHEIIICYKHRLDEGCTRAILEQEETVSFYSNGTTGLPDFSISKDCMLFLYDVEKQGEQKETLCDKCRKTQPSHSCQDITELGRCALEKQGEQKPADKVEPKFKIGDWIINGDYTWKIVEVMSLDYVLQSQDGNIVDDTISYVDEQFHSFTIEDAKDGDVLVFDDIIMIFKNVKTVCTANTYILYCDGIVVDDWCDFGYNAHPATKEQRDLLFSKMKEAGYEWDSEKKELKIIDWSKHIKYNPNGPSITEEKSAWSEENSCYYDDICEILINLINSPKSKINKDAIQKDLDWLMSIEKSQLKPAWSEYDEIISDAIWESIDFLCLEHFGVSEDGLYDWLKSLKHRVQSNLKQCKQKTTF